MLIYPNSKDSGNKNMATDWWLFENASAPCFRHYQWAFPETSFGYGQDWEWVVQTTSLSIEKLIRRPTGGGIVKHGSDWTYCLILPQTSFASKFPPLDLYKSVHQCIGMAFAKEDIVTKLQPCPTQKKKVIPGDCFEEPVGWDLMNYDSSEKIAGAAMKRSRKGLLLQGTISRCDEWVLDGKRFESNFIYFLSEILGEQAEHQDWPVELLTGREEVYEQFSSLNWKKNRIRN